MKKTLISLIFLLLFSLNGYLCPQGYSFWIWSPKTQKWKNPQQSPLATPYLQYREALKLFENDRQEDAYKEFKKLIANYPDAKEAAQAQYYIARCLEKFGKPYEAFLEYQKLIDSYPNSQRINEVVEREYNIGEYFLNRERKKWMGVSLYDFVDHPSIEIFSKIAAKVPYSEYAPRAQYKLGIMFAQLGRYDEARDAFQKVVDNYSDSEWAAPAKYQLAVATAKAFPGADYDSSYLKEAAQRLDEFIGEHPEARISSQAQEQLKQMRNSEAKKIFDTAQFYENQGRYDSAVIYYSKISGNYPDTDCYNLSLEKIDEMKELIEGNITKKDLKKMEKKEITASKRAEKNKSKENKSLSKKERKEEKLREELERMERKKELKKRKKEEKNKLKDLRKQEKLREKQEAKERKQVKRREKLEKKRTDRENKIQLKSERRAQKQRIKEKKGRKN